MKLQQTPSVRIRAFALSILFVVLSIATIDAQDRTHRLVAGNGHSPEAISIAEDTLLNLLSFAIPQELVVSKGNAGNGVAWLQFRINDNQFVTCVYKGGASSIDPTTSTELAKGRKYVLQEIDAELKAGDVVTTDYLKLSVISGSSRLGPVEVQLTLPHVRLPKGKLRAPYPRLIAFQPRVQSTASVGSAGDERISTTNGELRSSLAPQTLAVGATVASAIIRPEVLCGNALGICSPMMVADAAYTENVGTNEINPALSCLDYGSINGVWYTFKAKANGSLNFTIKPENQFDDYDWAVYDITGRACGDIQTVGGLEIGCNFSWDADELTAGYTGANGNTGSWNGPPISVVANNTYRIFVSFFNDGLVLNPALASQHGFVLDLSASGDIFQSVSASAGPDVSICRGASTPLNATVDKLGEFTYQWLPTTGLNNPNIRNPIARPLTTTTYTVTVKDLELNCIVTPTVKVTVRNPPTPGSIVAKGITCLGATDGEISFSVTGGTSPYTIKLNGGNLPPEGVTLTSPYVRTGLASAQYTITATGNDGCSSTTSVNVGYGGPAFAAHCHANVKSTETDCTTPAGTINTGSPRFTLNRTNPAGGTYNYQVFNSVSGTAVTGVLTGTFGTATTIPNLGVGTYRVDVNANGCLVSTPANNLIKVEALQMTLSSKLNSNREEFVVEPGKAYDYCTLNPCGQNVTLLPQLAFSNSNTCSSLTGLTRTFKLYKKINGTFTEYRSTTSTAPVNANSLTIPINELLGEYKLEATLQNYGCAKAIPFSIYEVTPPIVNLFVSPETCPGRNDGAVSVTAVDHLISPVTYELYNVTGADNCSKTIVPSKTGASITGLAPGKYCIKVRDSRGDAVSCKCHDFEVFSGNYKTTPVLLPGEKKLWPYTVSTKTTLTANRTLATCAATVTASGGTPPYKFIWKREVEEKRAVWNETDQAYVEELQTVEYALFEETNTTGISNGTGLKSGKHNVYITDNCTATPLVQTFVIPVPARTYNLCFRWETGDAEDPQPQPPAVPTNTIAAIAASNISRQLEDKAEECINEQVAKIDEEQKEKCLSLEFIADEVGLRYNINTFHYTLYYYDRSGKLVRTVAPNGVNATATNRDVVPLRHTNSVTKYNYNSQKQMLSQVTPDGGTTFFIYNIIGQMRFSQSERQRVAVAGQERYTYTKYDELARVIEVGETTIAQNGFAALITNASDASFPSTATLEKVNTIYSQAAGDINYLGRAQRNLLNRVSYSVALNNNGKTIRTFYSYDPHGNVEWIVQDIPGIGRNTVAYEYDLISNKITKVLFNENRLDQFLQRYKYDEDNSIVSVETSKDGYIWDRDATYDYYAHGPLRNIGIGEDNIQKLDYVHTIHGWLKGVNTPDLAVNALEGEDKLYAQDKFSMGLGYYEGDFFRQYNTLNSPFNWKTGSTFYLSNGGKNLYNGNVSTWISKIGENKSLPLDNTLTGYVFTYDRLNRLKTSKFNSYSTSFTATNNFATAYTYDASGNILSLKRNGDTGSNATFDAMDNLVYVYETDKNRLKQIVESASDAAFEGDIKAGQPVDNYVYDGSGNLVEDKQEKLYLSWTTFGKVSEVRPYSTTTGKPGIVYTYDANGNRIIKEVNKNPYASGVAQRRPQDIVLTFYVRDPTGHLLAIYEQTHTAVSTDFYKAELRLKELPIYGADRIGQLNSQQLISSKVFHISELDQIRFDVEGITRKTVSLNWLALAKRTDIATGTAKNINSYHANLATYSTSIGKYQPANGFSFAGNSLGNVALAEDTVGNIAAMSVTAQDYFGRPNVCLVYDKNGHLLPNSNAIYADPKAKSVIVKQPGGPNYILFTLTTDGRIYYHVIDMTLQGNPSATGKLGDINHLKNQELDLDKKVTYGRAFAVIEDYINNKVILYATRYTAPSVAGNLGTKEVVSFEITADVAVQRPKVLTSFPSLDKKGEGELQVNPNGKTLLVANYLKQIGWTWQRNTEIRIFNLGSNFELVSSNGQSQSPIESVHTMTVPGGSLPITANFNYDNKYILFAQKTINTALTGNVSEAVWSRNFYTSTQLLVQGNVFGDIRRGKDNRMYVAQRSTDKVLGYGENTLGAPVTEPAKDFQLNFAGVGYLANEIHKIYPDRNPFEGIYAREVGNKDYELKDHLGDVSVVVTDVKLATLSGLNVRNTAFTKGYYNYYPYGMFQPRRYSPGNDVASGGYRYGYNGRERDDDWKGVGNSYDFEGRIYDPRVGRWLSVDPKAHEFPYASPYNYALNNPIILVDPDGQSTKPSEFIKANLGMELTPMAAGLIDGMVEGFALTAMISFAVDLADPEFLDQMYTSMQMIASDPVGFVKMVIEEEMNGIKDIIEFNEKGQYKLGEMLGEKLGAAISGGGATLLLKYVKRYREKAKIVEKIADNLDCLLCFAAGTQVLTSDGYKDIESLKEGDLVWSYVEESDTLLLRPVTKTYTIHEREKIYHVYIQGEEIKATGNHPFFIKGNWIEVKDLKAGDSVTLYSGEEIPIDSIKVAPGEYTVFNFTVDDAHNYYVSKQGVLVHNCGGKKGPIKKYEVTTYSDFKKRSVKGDNLEGHEVLQNAHLQSKGLTDKRLDTDASKNNPVIALPKEQHKVVNKAQRLIDHKNPSTMKNINANMKILKDLKKVPEKSLQEIKKSATKHAKNTGLIKK